MTDTTQSNPRANPSALEAGSTGYLRAFVRQTIPADCLTSIERWLLTRLFKKTRETDDGLDFDATWSINELHNGGLFPDDELTEALATSREICPELCAEVEREINERAKIAICDISYLMIFQPIVQRHSDILPQVSIEESHVSIEECEGSTPYVLDREVFTMITAQCITLIDSRSELIPPHHIRCIGYRLLG
jgi:hypothetical protein